MTHEALTGGDEAEVKASEGRITIRAEVEEMGQPGGPKLNTGQ